MSGLTLTLSAQRAKLSSLMTNLGSIGHSLPAIHKKWSQNRPFQQEDAQKGIQVDKALEKNILIDPISRAEIDCPFLKGKRLGLHFWYNSTQRWL